MAATRRVAYQGRHVASEERSIRNEALSARSTSTSQDLEERVNDPGELLPLFCGEQTGCMVPIEVDRATFEAVRRTRSVPDRIRTRTARRRVDRTAFRLLMVEAQQLESLLGSRRPLGDDISGLGTDLHRAISSATSGQPRLPREQPNRRSDALLHLDLLAEQKPEKLERACVRWHGRLETEATFLSLAESQLALAALASLCAGERDSIEVLRRLLRRVGPSVVPRAL